MESKVSMIERGTVYDGPREGGREEAEVKKF